ncbi:D-aminopeptidase [Herbaspirillum sp. Sphag1AN]|uniref:DmpA family aminopeptidase n=1 Tax=unclassified Herbaspirillum TaxID=2624150 RepID=UPI00161459D3|nr:MULTISPECIES: P1 family peptidase [unclassified Herbaspirillum]MBB3211728.1 D-aminopeptidase [Herbaspirillum sp. Sphag1AN]
MMQTSPLNAVPHIGRLSSGPVGNIADVSGVSVGHCTLNYQHIQTGVTVVRAHAGDAFLDKVPAAAVTLNGFGKSIGLLQVQELGVLETPIALTNTFAVGTVATAQMRAACADNPEIGRALPSVNPLVFECNDGYLNDMQAFAVEEHHYLQALNSASGSFVQGAVGAGRGMSCFELKGGIGSASRLVSIGGNGYTVGALVLANFGKLEDLILNGDTVGRRLKGMQKANREPEKGSIIMLIATDAPLDARQLRRLASRAGAGLARTGSVYGHGSGDIALAFSTAQTVPQWQPAQVAVSQFQCMHDALLDPLFHAAADSIEQAIINALFAADAVTGRDGHQRQTLRDMLAMLATMEEA